VGDLIDSKVVIVEGTAGKVDLADKQIFKNLDAASHATRWEFDIANA
jgi:hypothetical protein